MKRLRRALDVRVWRQDGIFRRLTRNAGILVGGSAAASVLDLGSVALTARALGAEQFGVIALIKTYAFIVERLLTFQSWQALIKYGAERLERGEREDFKRLVKFGTLLDAATAVASAAIGALAVVWVGRWRGWAPEVIGMASLYSLTNLFSLRSTPTAVLRLFDRFNRFAAQEVIASACKLIAVAVAYWRGAGLWTFVIIWAATAVGSKLLLVAAGWIELRARGFRGVLSASLRGLSVRCEGLWKFVWMTNLNASLKVPLKEADLLLVGGLLGLAPAGVYKIAKQCAHSVSDLATPLYHAIYPELAKLWAKADLRGMKRLVFRSGVTAGTGALLLWIVVLMVGTQVLPAVFGPDFAGAQTVLVWYLLGVVMDMGTLSLAPALLAAGRPGWQFRIDVVSAGVYLLVLWVLIGSAGLVGAGMAYLLQQTLRALAMACGAWAALKPASRAGRLRPAVSTEGVSA